MRVLYFDCFSGISGDMAVGALRDLGVEESVFHSAIAALGLGGKIHSEFQRGARQRIAGWKFEVRSHDRVRHIHDDDRHARTFRNIRSLIEESNGLSDFIKVRGIAVFQRIAVAEGKIHGVPPEDVEFHEVGALDSIADIVAACAGIEALDVERVFASSLIEGSGWTDCAHGRFPVPAPATLEILCGIPLQQVEEPYELITPTGAALLAEFSSSFGSFPEMKIEKIGYGLGTRTSGPGPNVLRALLGECGDTSNAEVDEIMQIETNLDDMSPELAGVAMERLFAAGALDAFFTAAQMKKNRPAFVLTGTLHRREVSRSCANSTNRNDRIRRSHAPRATAEAKARVPCERNAIWTGAHETWSSWRSTCASHAGIRILPGSREARRRQRPGRPHRRLGRCAAQARKSQV